MPQPLPRFNRKVLLAEQAATLARILAELEDSPASTGQTAPGDGRRMRGVPIVGRSTAGGAVAGTDPLRALLAKEARRGR